jgi:hypothetical protein
MMKSLSVLSEVGSIFGIKSTSLQISLSKKILSHILGLNLHVKGDAVSQNTRVKLTCQKDTDDEESVCSL